MGLDARRGRIGGDGTFPSYVNVGRADVYRGNWGDE
jgi:hypothetical protein